MGKQLLSLIMLMGRKGNAHEQAIHQKKKKKKKMTNHTGLLVTFFVLAMKVLYPRKFFNLR